MFQGQILSTQTSKLNAALSGRLRKNDEFCAGRADRNELLHPGSGVTLGGYEKGQGRRGAMCADPWTGKTPKSVISEVISTHT